MKKKVAATEPEKETASEKSEGMSAPAMRRVLLTHEERIESLEITVNAIRREYKSKGIPMP